MKAEDLEFMHLIRDAIAMTVASRGRVAPSIFGDKRGSAGYAGLLGRYSQHKGPVFVRISKREIREGNWVNRCRGCQCVGLLRPDPATFAEMAIKSAVVTATRARKVRAGPTQYHKPIWASEFGSLSYFAYLVEDLVQTSASTAAELEAEGQNVHQHGLIAIAADESARGVVCGGLPTIGSVSDQVGVALRKGHDERVSRPLSPDRVRFIRMKGRWLWDPARPMDKYF